LTEKKIKDFFKNTFCSIVGVDEKYLKSISKILYDASGFKLEEAVK